MAKRKESGIETIASMPWPIGIALGVIAYLGIRYGTGWLLASSAHSTNAAASQQMLAGLYAPLAWLALGVSWLGALLSYIRQRQRKRLLDTQTGLDSIRAMSWRQFEVLVGEAFRRQGYSVQETGLGGADGGIDLVLRKAGAITLVQCKQWRNRQVNVNVVREMYGLLTHHGAAAVKIVAVGSYTNDARRFAQGKPIELIHGEALLAMVREGQADHRNATVLPTTPTASVAEPPSQPQAQASTNADNSRQGDVGAVQTSGASPTCPRCGNTMVERSNKRTNEGFWGCSNFPKCMGTRSA